MSQLLDHAPPDYRPPIRSPLVVIASLYRGYTDTGEFTDVEYNLKVAEKILSEYWWLDIPAISLVLQWRFLGAIEADDKRTHDQAQRWCLEIVRHADAVHFHYPRNMYLSRGMRLEYELATRLGIECFETEREW